MNKEIYNKINNSFKKEYIFHIGAEAGFYSELNNMIFSMLYCLQHGYKFKLYSADANFGFKKGWEDYFLPFCKETRFDWHHHYNKRTSAPYFSKEQYKSKLIYKAYRKLFKKTNLTFDLWDKFFSYEFNDASFDIPQLGIKGNLNSACNQLIKIVYQFNPEVKNEIDAYKEKMNLPNDYIAFQIRRGDKNIEKEYVSSDTFFDYLIKNYETKNIFILADDYKSILKVKEKYPKYNIFTLTDINENGYVHADFVNQSKQVKKEKIIKLLASIEIMRDAVKILGVFAANTEMFLGMAVPQKMVWLDGQEWAMLGKVKPGLSDNMLNYLKVKTNVFENKLAN